MHMLPKLFKAVSKLPDEVLAVHGGDGSCISPVADPASGGTPSSLRDTCLAAALNNARAKNFMARYEPYKIFPGITNTRISKKKSAKGRKKNPFRSSRCSNGEDKLIALGMQRWQSCVRQVKVAPNIDDSSISGRVHMLLPPHTKQQIYNRIKKLEKMKTDPILLEKNTAIARFSKANKKLASQNPNAVIRNPIVELQARLHALGQPNLNPMASKGTKAKKEKNEKKSKPPMKGPEYTLDSGTYKNLSGFYVWKRTTRTNNHVTGLQNFSSASHIVVAEMCGDIWRQKSSDVSEDKVADNFEETEKLKKLNLPTETVADSRAAVFVEIAKRVNPTSKASTNAQQPEKIRVGEALESLAPSTEDKKVAAEMFRAAQNARAAQASAAQMAALNAPHVNSSEKAMDSGKSSFHMASNVEDKAVKSLDGVKKGVGGGSGHIEEQEILGPKRSIGDIRRVASALLEEAPAIKPFTPFGGRRDSRTKNAITLQVPSENPSTSLSNRC